MVHKISIETTHKSKARLFWGKIKTRKILLEEHYEITLKMRNVGEKDFPGGEALIQTIYTAPQSHSINFVIPEIKRGAETPPIELPSRAAIGKGYASFLCKIIAKDGEHVKIIRDGQELSNGASFYDIFIKTRTGLYNYYMLVISIFSFILLLIVLVLQLR